MKQFKNFGIKPSTTAFTGDKIKIDRVLNKEITVVSFRIEGSKFDKGNGKCLYVQIIVDGDHRVFFSGSSTLMDMIQRVDSKDFPFTTTIVKENGRLEFS